MTSGARVRRLQTADAALVVPLRREALETAPLSFGATVEDDKNQSVEFVRASLADERNQAMFGGFENDRMVGLLAIRRESGIKRAHRVGVFSVFVTPRSRGRGMARELLDAAIAQVRAWGDVTQLELGVTDAAPGARRMYEAAGFREWGREPRAIRHQGRYVDMFKLALAIDVGVSTPPE
ncbi:MAG: GNAT family N-acetyltransferase [Candidatus Eisenbacteria bacterium]|uniref:GNAT family N-acetyltransferase n=1 Tax=Eiseniibacteriota bacterium TaxID=2212470 RepID=A0A849SGQ9_UNCEI|nr:GNAT family N-acetyltransferase [Candidatus Eisenbacteria bacterium]